MTRIVSHVIGGTLVAGEARGRAHVLDLDAGEVRAAQNPQRRTRMMMRFIAVINRDIRARDCCWMEAGAGCRVMRTAILAAAQLCRLETLGVWRSSRRLGAPKAGSAGASFVIATMS